MSGIVRPHLSWWRILQMNIGFFGLQFSFGLQQSNMAPIYRYLGASEATLPLLWMAGDRYLGITIREPGDERCDVQRSERCRHADAQQALDHYRLCRHLRLGSGKVGKHRFGAIQIGATAFG